MIVEVQEQKQQHPTNMVFEYAIVDGPKGRPIPEPKPSSPNGPAGPIHEERIHKKSARN